MQCTENTKSESRSSGQSYAHSGRQGYLRTIFKYRRMILSLTFAATFISAIYVFFLPNVYTAKTLILPAQEDRGLMSSMMSQFGGLAGLAGGMGGALGGPTTADLYVSMLKSEAVKDPIVDRFKLMEVYDTRYRIDAYRVIDRNITILLGKKDGIITLTVSDQDPTRAAALANAFVEELGHLAVRLNVAGAGENRIFLAERLAKATADLSRAEENLKTFQAKHKAVSVTAQAEATIKGVAELRAQLAAQEVQLATFRRQFTDSSQEVKNLAISVSNLRSQIAKLEGAGAGSALPSVGTLPSIGQEYVRLVRELKIQESLVELLTKQHEMAKFSEAKEVMPVQVILSAKVPERKSGPARTKLVLFTAFFVFCCTLLGAFFLEYIKSTSKDGSTVWKDFLPFSLFKHH